MPETLIGLTNRFKRPKTAAEAEALKEQFLEYRDTATAKSKEAQEILEANVNRLVDEIEETDDPAEEAELQEQLDITEEYIGIHMENTAALESYFRRGRRRLNKAIADLQSDED